MTKTDIISGFLGAGKTTFIRKMIEEVFRDEKTVLIENEFGEVGIDSGFLKDSGIEITEMNSGCICCSLVGDFDKNLREVVERFKPDRIVIEPSGVGKLSDVMTSVTKLEGELDIKVNGLVTVVNGPKAIKQMKAFGEFFNNQIEYASTIVISRTQNMEEDRIEDLIKHLREHNKDAAIITTPWDKLKGDQILKAMEGADNLISTMKELAEKAHKEHEHEHHHHHDHDEEHGHHHEHEHEHDEEHECCHGHHHHEHDEDHECCHGHHHEHKHEHGEEHECCHGHHHDHDADEVFTSWGMETPHRFEKETVENALKTFAESDECGVIIRAKGMVESTGGSWIYFDFVDGEYELREGMPDYTGRIAVIGANLNEHEIKELFGL